MRRNSPRSVKRAKPAHDIAHFPFPVLFRNPYFVVINKPAGLAVHPGPKHTISVETFLPALSQRKDGPWLAHRLDADTAGCLLIALRKQALIQAQALFQNLNIEKLYWAAVSPPPEQDEGVCTLPLLKQQSPKGWRIVVSQAGQNAVTHWRVLHRDDQEALVELHLKTGRTHQARVHCAAMGFPILGDGQYGGLKGPMQLLARSLQFDGLSGPVSAQAPLPPHMAYLDAKFPACSS